MAVCGLVESVHWGQGGRMAARAVRYAQVWELFAPNMGTFSLRPFNEKRGAPARHTDSATPTATGTNCPVCVLCSVGILQCSG